MSESRPGGLSISFLCAVDHGGVEETSPAARTAALEASLDLFALADELGYDAGYVRARHLQSPLASPLLFLAAAGQRARRMDLGTAVIPLWFENPARLAEDLATTDLLLGGRLLAGLSSGYSAQLAPYVDAFGITETDPQERVDRVLAKTLDLIDGTIVATADAHVEDIEPGSSLRIQPQVRGLRSRLAYGAGGPARAARAGAQGLGLQLATLQPDDGTQRTFEDLQLEAIAAYREASREAGHGEGRVAVSRQVVPVADEDELERFLTLLPRERSVDPADGEHRGREIGGGRAVFSRVVLDTPDVVAEALTSDRAVAAADELILALPFQGRPDESARALTTFAHEVAPQLRG